MDRGRVIERSKQAMEHAPDALAADVTYHFDGV